MISSFRSLNWRAGDSLLWGLLKIIMKKGTRFLSKRNRGKLCGGSFGMGISGVRQAAPFIVVLTTQHSRSAISASPWRRALYSSSSSLLWNSWFEAATRLKCLSETKHETVVSSMRAMVVQGAWNAGRVLEEVLGITLITSCWVKVIVLDRFLPPDCCSALSDAYFTGMDRRRFLTTCIQLKSITSRLSVSFPYFSIILSAKESINCRPKRFPLLDVFFRTSSLQALFSASFFGEVFFFGEGFLKTWTK